MQFRDHEAVKGNGKVDTFRANPRMLKIDPTYNVRDMADPETIAHVRWLADSIKESGVRVPLEVRIENDEMFVVAGHCRHAATMLAISEGAEIATVLCLQEPKGTNEIERVLNLVISNSGKALTPLAIAEVVRRLLAFGWDNAKIATRLGWKTPAALDMYTNLLSATPDVQEMVRSGTVAASTAAKVVKREGSGAGATLAAAASLGGKVTAKTIREVRGEFDPTPANVSALIESVKYTARFADRKCQMAAQGVLERLGVGWELAA
jgi:ParB family chromosome partitioning protein